MGDPVVSLHGHGVSCRQREDSYATGVPQPALVGGSHQLHWCAATSLIQMSFKPPYLPALGGRGGTFPPFGSASGGTASRTFLPQAGGQPKGARIATRVSPSACGGSTGDEGAGEGGACTPTALELPARGTSPSHLRPPLSGAGTFLPQAGGQWGPLPPTSASGGTASRTFLPQAGGQPLAALAGVGH